MLPRVQLLVTVTDDGLVQVQGPIQDKVLCYGLLEAAKDAIRDYRPPTVERPRPGQIKSLIGPAPDA